MSPRFCENLRIWSWTHGGERKIAKWGCMHKTKEQLRCLDLLGICAENKRGREKSICVCVFVCGQIGLA